MSVCCVSLINRMSPGALLSHCLSPKVQIQGFRDKTDMKYVSTLQRRLTFPSLPESCTFS